MTSKIESLKNAFIAASENEGIVKAQAQAMLESAENDADKIENKKTMQRAATHEKYNAALAGMSDKALAVAVKFKIDADSIARESRELKKRTIAALECIAHNKRANDLALDAVLTRLAAKRDDSLTIAQIHREMNHKADAQPTQANYFKTWGVYFNFIDYSKSDKTCKFDYNNAFLKALLDVYA